MIFKSKRESFKFPHYSSGKEFWIKYTYKFENHPKTKTKKNYMKFNRGNYLNIIDVTNITIVLEGDLMLEKMKINKFNS